MSTKFFTASEIENHVYYNDVAAKSLGSGRWAESMETVFEDEEGDFYKAYWRRGLTEMQPDEFDDAELTQVKPRSKIVVSSVTEYIPVDEDDNEQKPIFSNEELEILKDITKGGAQALEHLSTNHAVLSQALDLLDAIEALAVTPSQEAYHVATKEYLEELKRASSAAR